MMQIEVFSFEELSETSKDRVRTWYSEHGMDCAWWDSEFEYWADKLRGVGITVDDDPSTRGRAKPSIRFSGFWSQGDGACFEGRVAPGDMVKFMDAHELGGRFPWVYKLASMSGVSFSVRHVGHYSHEYCTRFEFSFDSFSDLISGDLMEGVAAVYDDNLNGEVTGFEVAATDICRSYMRDIYKDLRSDYEGMMTDEAISDTCQANDWLFTADGRFFRGGLSHAHTRASSAAFVESVAGLSIWDYDKGDGTPYEECDEPAEGYLDSHVCLMQLIEQARSMLNQPKEIANEDRE